MERSGGCEGIERDGVSQSTSLYYVASPCHRLSRSTEHSSDQMTLDHSSQSQALLSRHQAYRLATTSSISKERCFAGQLVGPCLGISGRL